MLKNILKVSVFSASVAVCALANAQTFPTPDQEDTYSYSTLMMDTTGSMNNIPSPVTGLSRCENAKEILKGDLRSVMYVSKNVKIVGFDTNLQDVSGGFINTTGLNPFFGDGLAIYNDLSTKVDALSCTGGTAIGDSACEVIDEISQARADSGDSLGGRIGIYTDAGEWASDPNICGGDVPDYVYAKVLPKAVVSGVEISPVALGAFVNGNVGLSVNDVAVMTANLESQPVLSAVQGFSTIQDEITALRLLAQFTGGTFNLVDDDDVCDTGCGITSPSDDDPWTGGGFGR